MSGNVERIEDIGLVAVVDGKTTPITSASISCESSGYTFSVGLLPTSKGRFYLRGTYGALYYNGGLLMDGILVGEGPLANHGSYTRQLIFRDTISYLEYLYLNFDIIKTEGDAKDLDIYGAMRNNNIDYIDSSEIGIFGSLAKMFNAFMTSGAIGDIMKAKYAGLTDEAQKIAATQDAKGMAASAVRSELEKKTEDSGSIVATMLARTIDVIGASKNMLPIRSQLEFKRRISSRNVANIPIEASNTQYFFQVVPEWISTCLKNGTITPIGAFLNYWLGRLGYQRIVVPGRIDNQVLFVPDYPFLGTLKCNHMSGDFTSASLSLFGDMPSTLAIAFIPLAATMVNKNEGSGRASFDAGLSSIEASKYAKLTKVGKLRTEPYDAFGSLGYRNKKGEQIAQRDWLNAMAGHILNCEALQNNTLTIQTDKPQLDLVPGFYGEIHMGDRWYGRVARYDAQFTPEGHSQTVQYDFVIKEDYASFVSEASAQASGTASNRAANPERTFWLGNTQMIGMYEAGAGFEALNSMCTNIDKNRRDAGVGVSRVTPMLGQDYMETTGAEAKPIPLEDSKSTT